MKLTKSLVKKGGKKSLKKTLKMLKSKKGGKKSLNTKKARKSRKMKGGELTMEDPPKKGECIKKGIMGVHTYTVVQVNPSDGNYQPTVDVIDSSGMPRKFNLGEMVRCVAIGKKNIE